MIVQLLRKSVLMKVSEIPEMIYQNIIDEDGNLKLRNDVTNEILEEVPCFKLVEIAS